jgi:hypothetical protein
MIIKKGINTSHMNETTVVASSVDWGVLLYQLIIAGCAIGGLLLSIKNYRDRKKDSKPQLKLVLDNWIDTTNLVKQKCIRCVISNTGKLPVKYENLGIYINHNGSDVELYHIKWVSFSTEQYSARTNGQDIIYPNDARMAVVRPQSLVRELENRSISDRNILISVNLKSAVGDIFQSNKITVNLSGIDSYDRNSNRIPES